MVPAPQHSAPDILHLVHSGIGSVCNSSQSQAARIFVASSKSKGSDSRCSFRFVVQMMGLRLPTNRTDVASPFKFANSDQCRVLRVALLPQKVTLLADLVGAEFGHTRNY